MTASAIQPAQPMPLVQSTDFTSEQIDLIKQTVAAGTSDLELALFLEVAKSSGLNPFQRQIYAVMRWDAKTRKEKMVIQTGIDGYRLIAARSGVHMGTTDPEFGPINKDGFPEFARVIVRKLVHGHVAEFPATARWAEYVQLGKEGPTAMWKRMPHTMLGKCAEALALRKAFPAELSGVYSDVEMAQAENGREERPAQQPQSARPVDVTREVQEAAGTPAHTLADPQQEEVLQRWVTSIGDMATRVRRVAPADEVQAILDKYAWRTTTDAARACHTDLKELGLKHAPQPTQPAPQAQPEPTPVPAEALLTEPQRKALCAHAGRAGAKTSEDRAGLWAYLLNSEQAIRTRDLTDAQADVILGTFSTWSNDEAAQALTEARRAVLPF
ncbi:phage recombination protein Bet [Deinococcus soli (ex Cha et al. 2016)]|uniref:phage recombination protein Bet n=1 Tax=Deinococcus soli (ex Cha et al. 2016) TaxID=1309411 RepID=UPI00166C920E|nr:phage recombination protein Bet [Deinococcus soli (ex Cha et al. 2016)]GGB71591.1 hypothetical protein GCM10008019_29660 [Deinococcus soli (ex Cha et al. 2016)]